jgi:glycosyltransferase involved in cell wall biosynthesis
MKIAALVPHLKVNGGNRIIFTLCTLLSKRGHDVTIVVTSRRRFRGFVSNFLGLGKPPWFPGFQSNVLRVTAYEEKYLRAFDVIVSLSSPGTLSLEKCENIPMHKKFFYAMHDERLYHYPKELVEKAYRSPVRKIALSSWVKEIVEMHGNTNVPVLIAPVDTKLFHPIEGLRDKNMVTVLMLHHTYDWKGADEGVAIVERLKKKYPNVRLILYGVRSEKPDLPHDEYHYDVDQDKLSELYSRADIFLCPSWDEGLGMPGMEAMACGAALVTYDTGGSRDYAFDGRTAFVAPRRDIPALEAQLERAITDESLRHKIAKEGYEFITHLPSWEEQAEKMEDILSNQLS